MRRSSSRPWVRAEYPWDTKVQRQVLHPSMCGKRLEDIRVKHGHIPQTITRPEVVTLDLGGCLFKDELWMDVPLSPVRSIRFRKSQAREIRMRLLRGPLEKIGAREYYRVPSVIRVLIFLSKRDYAKLLKAIEEIDYKAEEAQWDERLMTMVAGSPYLHASEPQRGW